MAVDPAKTYHGTPCRRAGHTLRWKSSGECVACCRLKQHVSNLSEEQAERRRERNSAHERERFQRLYWGDGIESFIYRSQRQLRDRRYKALRRIAKRNEEGRPSG